jgi:hypothetical protein
VLVNGEESNLPQLQLLAVAISELSELYNATTGSAANREDADQHSL